MVHEINKVTNSELLQIKPLIVGIFILVMMVKKSFRAKKKKKIIHGIQMKKSFTKKDEKAVLLIKSIADVYKTVDDYIKM